ncbi:MAG: hemerythrin domain-containing protein [Pirellulales bacterium]|nr:hemerythrin domain-containing protein [Pirellulales bacterium]
MTTYEMETLLGHLSVEHRELHARLQHLRQIIAACGGSPTLPPPERLAEFVRELELLEEELRGHFAREEAGGYLEEAVTRRPVLNQESERLIHEHQALLAEMVALRKTVGSAMLNATIWPEAWARFHTLCRNLCEHESNENKLIQRGYNVDFNGLLE